MAVEKDDTMFDNNVYTTNIDVKEVVDYEIKRTIGSVLPEKGGILGGNTIEGITHYYYDKTAKCGTREYNPDWDTLNWIIQRWAKETVEFMGFVHSHPRGYDNLSPSDIRLAKRILENNDTMMRLYMFIVITESAGMKIYKYVVEK